VNRDGLQFVAFGVVAVDRRSGSDGCRAILRHGVSQRGNIEGTGVDRVVVQRPESLRCNQFEVQTALLACMAALPSPVNIRSVASRDVAIDTGHSTEGESEAVSAVDIAHCCLEVCR
jgi:hypothetical protein